MYRTILYKVPHCHDGVKCYCLAISIILCLMGFSLCTYMTIKVTIIYNVDPTPLRSSVIAASDPTLMFVCPEGPGAF